MSHRSPGPGSGLPSRPAPTRVTETLIISDLHLGLGTSYPEKVLTTLRAWRFDRLILAGDILHSDGHRRLCAESWQVVRHVRDLAQGRTADVVWLNGNHDRHLAPVIGQLTGIQLRESFAWRAHGRSYLVLHGDRFDWFNHHFASVGVAMGRLYSFCLRHLAGEGGWPRRLDQWHSGLQSVQEGVARKAATFAAQQGVDFIVCGHTHRPVIRKFRNRVRGGAVTYVNAGSWVDLPASYLTVDAAGVRVNHAE
jgi:UDP-2,3-diacylglucosamine pyrophosphatase LpxH